MKTVIALRRPCAVLALCFAALACTGCEIFGMAAYALVPPKQDAKYEIQDLPTAIIVDDPNNLLRDPQLAMLVANSCGETLKEWEAVKQVVEIKKVTDLAAQLGDKFAKTSPYDLGKQLGAKQVINVHVFSASESPEPGVLRPSMTVGIKLFDVEKRERLFPPTAKATGVPEATGKDGFYVHTASLRYRVSDANPARVLAIAREKLAEEAGSSIARVFFTHDPTKFDDIRQ